MKRIEDILKDYDPSDKTDRKKRVIIKWFQKHPEQRFDKTEIYQALNSEFDVGPGRVGQILKELVDESILVSHGDQRKAYELSDDILVPIKYLILSGLRHLFAIFDVRRWGVIGIFAIATTLWALITLPFWLFTVLLIVAPNTHVGPISQSEILIVTLASTTWLLVFVFATTSLQKIRLWWIKRNQSE